MSPASLESLTNELFEQVIQYLDLNDIRSVRLLSRTTAFKAAQDTYRAFFKKKLLDLTRESLDNFSKTTSDNGLGCIVEDLTLVGVLYRPQDLQRILDTGKKQIRPGMARIKGKPVPECIPEELEATREKLDSLRPKQQDDKAFRAEGNDVALLTQAFSNIASSKRGPLKCLSLRVMIDRNEDVGNFRPYFPKYEAQYLQVADRTFSLAMNCLRESRLSVQALNNFSGWPVEMNGTLPCDTLGTLDFTGGRWEASLSSLKKLSLSIADRTVDETEHDPYVPRERKLQDDETQSEQSVTDLAPLKNKIADEKTYAAIPELLHLCPSLEELFISRNHLEHDAEELEEFHKTMRRQYVHHLALMSPLTQLRKLHLWNLEMQGSDLLTLLRNHNASLRDLSLIDITLPARSFESVSSYITGQEMRLESIEFCDIREASERTFFRCDVSGDGVDCSDNNVVKLWGPARKDNLAYFHNELRMMGWAERWLWTLEQPEAEDLDEQDRISALSRTTQY